MNDSPSRKDESTGVVGDVAAGGAPSTQRRSGDFARFATRKNICSAVFLVLLVIGMLKFSDIIYFVEGYMSKDFVLKLKEGDVAPDFSAPTSGGGKVTLRELKGKNVLLYFYPKDDTPGCTKEACAFRDNFAEFKKRGAVVLGISTDSVKSHDKFIEKFKLPFTLVSDEDQKIVDAYGVWGEKSFMGRTFEGTHRVTFLIGPDGKIKKIWPKVKPDEHAGEVLGAL
jgi:thioredoxin-dependent peroxiredoxin